MAMVGDCSFALTTGNGQRSRLRRLENGFPQESVLVPVLFNIYICDLPTTISRKYACADYLATIDADGDLDAVEGALTKDVANVGNYLPDLEAEAQHHENGVGGLPSQQQVS